MKSTVHLAIWLLIGGACALQVAAEDVESVLQASPLPRGVACVPDCGTGELALTLVQQSGFLVLAMDEDPW